MTINDPAEDDWLSTAFHTDTYTSYWIGLNQPQGSTNSDANWTWVSGENSTYRNWYQGEPNGGGGENYAAKFFNFTLDGGDGVTDQWFDASDFWNFRGIIERTSSVPLPPALLLFASGLGAILLHRGRTRLNRRR